MSNDNPVGTRTGTRVVQSWIKVDGTITAIGLCRWYDLAQVFRYLRDGYQFYAPQWGALIFVMVSK